MKQKFIAIFFLIAFITASATRPLVAAETRISIGVTETMETFNPYGDSVALMYSVWCQVLGCLGTYDFDKGQQVWLVVLAAKSKAPAGCVETKKLLCCGRRKSTPALMLCRLRV